MPAARNIRRALRRSRVGAVSRSVVATLEAPAARSSSAANSPADAGRSSGLIAIPRVSVSRIFDGTPGPASGRGAFACANIVASWVSRANGGSPVSRWNATQASE